MFKYERLLARKKRTKAIVVETDGQAVESDSISKNPKLGDVSQKVSRVALYFLDN